MSDPLHLTKRQQFELLRAQLDEVRQSFVGHWRDIAQVIRPRRIRTNTNDVNRGYKVNQNIVDNTATLASRTLRAGMMAGDTSPARPWFTLSISDRALAEVFSVKEWLDEVTDLMRDMFLKSNIYNALPVLYGDMGDFATGAMYIEEDEDAGIRATVFPIGSYWISTNEKGVVDTFYREFTMTVRQMISMFAKRTKDGEIIWDNFSVRVRDFYDQRLLETRLDICHIVKPNEEFDPKAVEAKFKKFSSYYYERGVTGQGSAQSSYLSNMDNDRYLRESGYDEFPFLVPRWETTGEDSWGTDSPGMSSLGDIKQLQHGEKRGLQAIDKMVSPPMKGPTSLKNAKTSILPGDMTYTDEREGATGFGPVYQVNPQIEKLEFKQEQVRQRIKRAYHEDLFRTLIDDPRIQPRTAKEIEEKIKEKMTELGPVLGRLDQDLKTPLINISFSIMLKRGMIPIPPPELQGQDLKVEYTSILSQAQKLVGIGGLERFALFVGNMLAAMPNNPDILDRVDTDKLIEEYGGMTSMPLGVIRTDDDVAQIRQARNEANAQAQRMAAMKEMAGAAKNLGQADLSEDTALSRLLTQAQAGQLVPQ